MKDKWLRERHKKQKDNTEKRCANQRSALASLNIKISNQQAEIDRLKEALEEIKTVSELLNYDGIACVCDKVLNGESEINE